MARVWGASKCSYLWIYGVVATQTKTARPYEKTARRTSVTGRWNPHEGARMLKRYRRKNRSVSLLHAHLVFCSKFRRKVFTPAVFATLRASMETTARDLGVDIVAIEADRDHVHLMITFPPNLSLSYLVRRLKGASSRKIRARRFPEVLRTFWGKHFWSPSYFVVTCGGAPLEVVKRYVETQNAPDRQPTRHTHPPRNASNNTPITKNKQKNPNGPP